MMLSKSPKVGLFPFQMAVLWLINGGDPNYLLTGMILQVLYMVQKEKTGFKVGEIHRCYALDADFSDTPSC